MLKCMWMVLSWGRWFTWDVYDVLSPALDKKQVLARWRETQVYEKALSNEFRRTCAAVGCAQWDGGHALVTHGRILSTLRHPHLRLLFSGCPCGVQCWTLSVAPLTWMILVWVSHLTTLFLLIFQTRSSGSPSVCKIPHILRVNYFSAKSSKY